MAEIEKHCTSEVGKRDKLKDMIDSVIAIAADLS